ncbi:hypothetical protein ACN28E_40370 [Archangium lansingense]|uniref:hypothetical protein n=1 Tax=Archangium lansingense TaxID=2995310 RepID=UPI003B788B9E
MLSGIHSPAGIALDVPNGKAYVITYNATTLVTNQTTVQGIAIDVTAGRLYWSAPSAERPNFSYASLKASGLPHARGAPEGIGE